MAQDWPEQVDRFRHQYLQLETTLDFPDSAWLPDAQVQQAIYEQVFAEGSVSHFPPERYRLRTLKALVARIESSIQDWDEHEVSEELMTALGTLLSTPLPAEDVALQQRCCVTYYVSSLYHKTPSPVSPNVAVNGPHITLLENRSLISAGGTTGLRTWEASLHLGEYLCQNEALVEDKCVLELGAGTGYLSILCAKYLHCKHVIASDGSDQVINNFPENLVMNDLEKSSSIDPFILSWGEDSLDTEDQRWSRTHPPDVVLGADITYDESVIPLLVQTLFQVFQLNPLVEVLIAATQRNERTFQVFLDKCQMEGLAVRDLHFDVPPRASQSGPFYSDQVAIRICRVTQS